MGIVPVSGIPVSGIAEPGIPEPGINEPGIPVPVSGIPEPGISVPRIPEPGISVPRMHGSAFQEVIMLDKNSWFRNPRALYTLLLPTHLTLILVC